MLNFFAPLRSAKIKVFAAAIVCISMTACGAEVRVVERGDTALELLTYYGEWEEVVLIHGFFRNYDACNNIKEFYEERFLKRTYRCREL